jgi:hypothetical protein
MREPEGRGEQDQRGYTRRSVVDYRGPAVSALNRLRLSEELPVMAI